MEQQLKKVEAAQRRRMQVEKAARESEVWLFSILFSSLAMHMSYLECICQTYSKPAIIGWGNQKNFGPRFQSEEKGRQDKETARWSGTGKHMVDNALLYFISCHITFPLITLCWFVMQERAANAMLPSDSVRWVMGPSGSIVTFPDTIGLPTIFDSKPCRYSSILKSTGLLSDASLGSWIKYFSMFNY